MEALNRYLRGWMGYYALIETPSIVKEIQSWLRRRMRLVVWHQWKKPIARYRNLKRLGLTEDLARMIAYSSKGAWRTTRMYHTQFALNNHYWDKAGLVNLSLLHESIRRGW